MVEKRGIKMQKDLLAFSYQLTQKEDFEAAIKDFEKHGYTVHHYQIPLGADFYIDNLPSMVQKIKQENQEQKIVVLSNNREALFCWYRCYNDLIDDFVYVIDKNYSFIKDDEHKMFFMELANFTAINADEVQGVIYLNICPDNYETLYGFLLCNQNFRFFDALANYDYENKRIKSKLHKSYLYKNQVYVLDPDIEKEVIISLDIDYKVSIDMDVLLQHSYFFLFLLIEVSKQRDQQLDSFLVQYLRNLSKDNRKLCYHQQIMNYLNIGEHSFDEICFFLSLDVVLQVNDPDILQMFMETLKRDQDHLDKHYPVISNIMFYITHENLQLYDSFYSDFQQELRRVAYYLSAGFTKQTPESANERLAIIMDQLLHPLHAPTKVILDYARSFKEIFPHWEVKIFVEDNLYLNPNEAFLPLCYSSVQSKSVAKEHQNYINGYDIDIYYVNGDIPRAQRTQEILEQVYAFQPEIIWAGSTISPAAELLYESYPIVCIPMGGSYFTNRADVYLSGNRDEVINNNYKYGLLEAERIFPLTIGANLPEPVSVKIPANYGLQGDEFVIVTVGNRLDAEMSEDFIDNVVGFLNQHHDCCWLIVGPRKLTYLHNRWLPIIADKIRLVDFEPDLPALYKLCQVYLNPIRHGGGISIAMAMAAGLPVVISSHPSDGLAWTGEENGAGYEIKNLVQELELLYQDGAYRQERGVCMQERSKQMTIEKVIYDRVRFFELSKTSFMKRSGQRGGFQI
jgi:glycosyltransferase involved in cell wall biosynthesis